MANNDGLLSQGGWGNMISNYTAHHVTHFRPMAAAYFSLLYNDYYTQNVKMQQLSETTTDFWQDQHTSSTQSFYLQKHM